ncbi:hypothetical protein [uncultured Vagococcus sp.]|uniref:hypothetical protein n=1 Tax=uncultured Vagococcus sp. TaxID=189676 RepID=UPI0028D2B708|nr:hypothetical protein [uncultured Vagococcus sp.]
MRIFGLSLAEVAALLSVVSLLVAGVSRFYHQFRTTISAPLIDSMDKLRVEISQLEYHVVTEYEGLKSRTDQLDERLRLQERRLKKERREAL